MQKKTVLVVFAMMLGLVASTFAQDVDQKKKKQMERIAKGVTKQLMTFYKPAELTDEQKEKAMAIVKDHSAKLFELKSAQEKMLSAERKKARKEAIAAAKEEGLKGPKLNEAGLKAMKLSDDEMKAFKEAGKKVMELNAKMKEAINKTLTEDQIAQLPKRKGSGKGKDKGKKKQDKAGDTQKVSLKLPNMT